MSRLPADRQPQAYDSQSYDVMDRVQMLGAANQPGEGIRLLQMFPTLLSLGCILLYAPAIYEMLRMVSEPVIVFWFGPVLRYITLALPLVVFVCHVIHSKRARELADTSIPCRPAVLAAVLVPGIGLLFLAHYTWYAGSNYQMRLFSVDCDTFTEKRRLQESWMAASDIYTACIENMAPPQTATIPGSAQSTRITDCTEYRDMLLTNPSRARDWQYLRMLETEHGCTGWCAPGQELWRETPDGTPRDSCSVAAAARFEIEVGRTSEHVYYTCVITVIMCLVAILVGGDMARKEDIVW